MNRWIRILAVIDGIVFACALVIILNHTMSRDLVNAQVISNAVQAGSSTATIMQASLSQNASSSQYFIGTPKTAGPNDSLASTSLYFSVRPKQTAIDIHTQALQSIMSKIAQCESQGNPLATNPQSSAKGLLQILDSTWDAFSCDGNPFNATDNMRCGIKIASESGLRHWDASRACWIKLVQPASLEDNS